MNIFLFIWIYISLFIPSVEFSKAASGDRNSESQKIRAILDTDANNELDDQHAIAYLLLNKELFDVKGITINRTRNGGTIDDHYDEAMRIVRLCDADTLVKIYRGASGDFNEIIKDINNNTKFDGINAVNFIINEAQKTDKNRLTIYAVGKITNVALALYKAPEIARHIRIIWGAGNYPEPGGYNWSHDHPAVRYVFNCDVDLELMPARYRKQTGTDAVRVNYKTIIDKMTDKGPYIEQGVRGKSGKIFHCFGNYSVSLFTHYKKEKQKSTKALYDVAVLAISKNPAWAEKNIISVPDLVDRKWIERPENLNKMIVWENFNREAILADFFYSIENRNLE